MAQYKQAVAYGLSASLLAEAPFPVQAKRAPTTSDIGYIPGTTWVDKVGQAAYILISIVANVALWQLIAPAGGGSFTTLTSTGQFNLDTTAVGANTLGNTTGATSVGILVGTGGFDVQGVAASAFTIGTGVTTGSITIGLPLTSGTILIGGSAQTGSITLGSSTGAQTINVGIGATAAKTVNIATGASVANPINIGGTGANVIALGNTQTAGSISLGAAMTSGTINVGGTGAQTGAITIAGGTGAQTVAIAAAGTGAKTINIGANGSANTVGIGSTTAGSTITLRTPTGTQVTASNGLVATVGNVTLSNGDLVISTAATGVTLPGGLRVISGAGSPDTVVTAPAGSLFLRSDPAGATSRLYVNTDSVTAWTNITCAA